MKTPRNRNSKVGAGHKYYQLTHDYLVPSLRDWLTRKQRETRRGRAELRLADRAALWNAKPENRLLPSLWDFSSIRLLTDRKKWTDPERKMMSKAGRVQGTRCGIAAALRRWLPSSRAWEINGHYQAAVTRETTRRRRHRRSARHCPRVRCLPSLGRPTAAAGGTSRRQHQGSKKKLHLDLALLPVDQSKIAELRDDLLLVSPSPFVVVRDALLPYRDSVI